MCMLLTQRALYARIDSDLAAHTCFSDASSAQRKVVTECCSKSQTENRSDQSAN